jgi:acetyl/propionyl-CoA carboxylase alpha subunit
MIRRLLIANRGEIAQRIAKAARTLGIEPISLYNDAESLKAYLDIDRIMKIAKEVKADAIHPGYGFLSENPLLPEACAKNKIIFVGPSADVMRQMGNKVAAKQLMLQLGVPTVPGIMTDLDQFAEVAAVVDKIGYPVIIKAAAGGGGKGMRVVADKAGLKEAMAAAAREAKAAFGDDTVFVEKLVQHPRHIEIQILADAHGHVVHLGERDCSLQRRHQKIVEESPSPAITPELRAEMGAQAVKIAKSVGYVSAGTMEFLVDHHHNYYFLEMNTRLQVEHAVTEEVYGVDIVAWQLKIAQNEKLTLQQTKLKPLCHAIETRVYAEDPRNQFLPVIGRIATLQEPSASDVRVESALVAGHNVTIDYDPMLSKVISKAPTRGQAIARMIAALGEYKIGGMTTNIPFLIDILRSPGFIHGNVDTHFVETFCTHWSEFAAPRSDPFSPWHSASVTPDVIRGLESAGCRVKPGMTSRGRAKIAGSLNAPMPGRVIKILVEEGDSVDAGDALMVMEAMKMEHAIKAPAAGTVTKLYYKIGDMVEMGKKLAEVE